MKNIEWKYCMQMELNWNHEKIAILISNLNKLWGGGNGRWITIARGLSLKIQYMG